MLNGVFERLRESYSVFVLGDMVCRSINVCESELRQEKSLIDYALLKRIC